MEQLVEAFSYPKGTAPRATWTSSLCVAQTLMQSLPPQNLSAIQGLLKDYPQFNDVINGKVDLNLLDRAISELKGKENASADMAKLPPNISGALAANADNFADLSALQALVKNLLAAQRLSILNQTESMFRIILATKD